jgi:hypothetical protein
MTNQRSPSVYLLAVGELRIAAAKRQHHTGYRMNPLITRTSASSLTRM